MAHGTHAVEHHGLSVRTYILIGLGLTLITLVELGLSYSGIGALLIPSLLILSAVKFGIVVAYFMHLRFDSPVFTRMFAGSFFLALAILIALLGLFWGDSHTIPVG